LPKVGLPQIEFYPRLRAESRNPGCNSASYPKEEIMGFQITITLPAVVTFKRAGEERSFALEGMDASIIAELVAHGLTQKIGDAAAGKEGEEAAASMAKVHDALMRGDWGVRRAAADGMNAIEKAAFQMFTDAQAWPKKTKAEAKREQAQPLWDALSADARAAWLQEAQDEADRAKAAEERRARLAASLAINV
jgi:hypothetical protein